MENSPTHSPSLLENDGPGTGTGETEVCLTALGPGGGCGNFWKDQGNRNREVPVNRAQGKVEVSGGGGELEHLAVAVAQERPSRRPLWVDAPAWILHMQPSPTRAHPPSQK